MAYDHSTDPVQTDGRDPLQYFGEDEVNSTQTKFVDNDNQTTYNTTNYSQYNEDLQSI